MEKEYKIDRFHDDQPPPYHNQTQITPKSQARLPPSGYRIPLNSLSDSAFPTLVDTGEPPCRDADGIFPVFIGSAIFQRSVHPCKIAPHLSLPCHVPYGGTEVAHDGRYDLLPFDTNTMEWVPTSLGRIPDKRDPIQGGYEENGATLYHAMARVQGTLVPGKTGEHLGGCNVAFGNREHAIKENYQILCWKR